ncbi:diacylglycerol kinase family protein [Oceanobacillus bengalensis]|uniref:diacylglycerol kinase family protein n=1 Tax=Oceanobacillus bengalensis TaxID=1435466 RepID=UPI001FEA45BB|nr:diacylglycerol kinase family protein [Oceanobacillus bengalensis]
MKGKKRRIGFIHAWNGLEQVFKTELNFRIHLFAALFVFIAGLIVKLSTLEWAIIVLVVGQVLVTEVINSVMERMVDYFKPEIHPQAKFIKDVAAGAVLVAAITAVIIGLIIFIPKIYHLF